MVHIWIYVFCTCLQKKQSYSDIAHLIPPSTSAFITMRSHLFPIVSIWVTFLHAHLHASPIIYIMLMKIIGIIAYLNNRLTWRNNINYYHHACIKCNMNSKCDIPLNYMSLYPVVSIFVYNLRWTLPEILIHLLLFISFTSTFQQNKWYFEHICAIKSKCFNMHHTEVIMACSFFSLWMWCILVRSIFFRIVCFKTAISSLKNDTKYCKEFKFDRCKRFFNFPAKWIISYLHINSFSPRKISFLRKDMYAI